jgi:hypothetical protein
LIARLDIPLCIIKTDAFEEYITIANSSRFYRVSRQTTTRDFAKYFNDRRAQLVESLKSVSFIALTSDIWSSNAKEDYFSMIAHYVNVDWQLEKRIIDLRLIDLSHNAENIAERITSVLAHFGLTDKIIKYSLLHWTMLLLTLRLLINLILVCLVILVACSCIRDVLVISSILLLRLALMCLGLYCLHLELL